MSETSPRNNVRVLVLHDVGADQIARLRAAYPYVTFDVEFDTARAMALAPFAEVLFSKGALRQLLQAARSLRWFQAGIAGVDGLLQYPEIRDTDVVLTNASGAHGTPMAEQILAMMFAFATRLPLLVEARSARRRVSAQVIEEKFELAGQTIVVLGVGDVGKTLCQKCQALGMTVIGVRRTQREAPAWVHRMVTSDALLDVLPLADHVALCLPLTSETGGLFVERHFSAVKRGAYFYNVGRGQLVDQEAMIRALVDGRLGGAGLDVSIPDPPDPSSPLWDLPNVVLGQHTSGSSPYNSERITTLFIENLGRYLRDEPLTNVVDKRLGYPPE